MTYVLDALLNSEVSDNGKPVVRSGRKAMGLVRDRQAAERILCSNVLVLALSVRQFLLETSTLRRLPTAPDISNILDRNRYLNEILL